MQNIWHDDYIKELAKRKIYGLNTTIQQPWTAKEYRICFDYVKNNGIQEFSQFTNEIENVPFEKREVIISSLLPNEDYLVPNEETFSSILSRYPKIKEFLENNKMLNKKMLISSYFNRIFEEQLTQHPEWIDIFIENMKKLEALDLEISYNGSRFVNYTTDNGFFIYADAIYDITDDNEKLITIKKYYCDKDLDYSCNLEQKIFEKNKRIFRHEQYSVNYKDKTIGNIKQAPNHCWLLQVINDGKRLSKHMEINSLLFEWDNGPCNIFPAKEELDRLALSEDLSAHRLRLKQQNKIKVKKY